MTDKIANKSWANQITFIIQIKWKDILRKILIAVKVGDDGLYVWLYK